MLVKPRFGRRRWSGIWPPSKPTLREYPDRDFCPFSPRPAVLPRPEPGPRPTRFFLCVEPFAGFRLLRLIAIMNSLATKGTKSTKRRAHDWLQIHLCFLCLLWHVLFHYS